MNRTVATGAVRKESVWFGLMIGLLGFSLPFPGLLLPNLSYSPRYPDLIVVALIPFVWRAFNRTVRDPRAYRICALFLAAVIIPAITHSLLFSVPDAADFTYYVRWVAAVLLGVPLAWLLPERRDYQQALLIGIVVGAGLHLVTIWIAQMGGVSFLRAVGFASARVLDTSYNGEQRVTSLAEHPNAAMVLLGISVPAAMAYRLISPPNKGWIPIGVALVVLFFGFYFTLTRSATLAAVAAILVAMVQFFKRSDKLVMYYRAAYAAIAGIMILLAMLASQQEIAKDRLTERIASQGLEQNLEGRSDTINSTVELLQSYPLGIGWGHYLDSAHAGHVSASHNAYLFTARIIGLPMMLLLLIGHVRVMWRMAFTRRVDALPPLAFFVVAVMFAEDITQGMSLVFLTTFVAICGFANKPWASAIYRSVLVPPAPRAAARRSPANVTGRNPT